MTRVGLLMCGHVDPRAVRIAGDYPELFASLFGALGVELVRFDADQEDLPASLADCDGWITSPSRSSASDDEPWIHAMADLVQRLVAEERPFAGICFGHQLMAQALGGRVERSAAGWGVGAQDYEVVAPRPWMEPFPADRRFRLIASHEDQVTALPDDAELLASAPYCPVAMMAIGSRAIGIQAHPEFTAPLSAALLDLRVDLIGEAVVQAAHDTLSAGLDRELVAGWIVRFLRASG
ncbi:MAG: gamma-glutamyl-gamma-aminobutyrate hydrolase family protein [Acidimicrobiales bacterium]